MKSLEKYLEETVLAPENATSNNVTASEAAFLEKYVGTEWQEDLKDKGLMKPAHVESVAGFSPQSSETSAPSAQELAEESAASLEQPEVADSVKKPDENDIETLIAAGKDVQLVSFYLSEQEFAVPIYDVQEVIRRIEATKLPKAPPFVVGIINLRGRVTPIVDLASMLGVRPGKDDGPSRFIVVCKRQDLQIGLMVRSIATMHRAHAENIEWGIESSVGVAANYLSGLLKHENNLIKIVSVGSLISAVLNR
ncbi:chemotaxis protein CheW [Desulfovibrio inopinatus]|uniref:chemotaxis protein CheW n=1 Tax=Desulfovibrio inopinatus TaxID=102109 RepID=UPI0003FCF2D3|nr:chemotaxis protein CheW [Desulfovibrio inopinatus]